VFGWPGSGWLIRKRFAECQQAAFFMSGFYFLQLFLPDLRGFVISRFDMMAGY